MRDEALDAVYSYVERAYARLQAGDLMVRCLDENSLLPIQQMIEGLYMTGPGNLVVMREVLAEAALRKEQVREDLAQVTRGLNSSMRSYGVNLEDESTQRDPSKITPTRLMTILRRQNVRDDETQIACLRILKESRSLIKSLSARYSLLENLEAYLQDWLWGMVYQSTRPQDSTTM